MSTIGAFGGRGMGQTCGVADPSQWMKMFGIDIDSRDTTELLKTAKAISKEELKEARTKIQKCFAEPIPEDETAERSIRLYLALKKIVAKEGFDFWFYHCLHTSLENLLAILSVVTYQLAKGFSSLPSSRE